MMESYLIAIEGLDSSGKETQAKLLKKNLEKLGYSAEIMTFPSYSNNQHSKRIIKHLKGEAKLSSNELLLEFAYDRFFFKKTIFKKLLNNNFLIIDRYTYSNVAYQGADLPEIELLNEYTRKIEELEFFLLELPKPDICFFLDMKPEFCFKLMVNKKKDINEKNEHFLRKVYEKYLFLFNDERVKRAGFETIKCFEEDIIYDTDYINKQMLEIILERI